MSAITPDKLPVEIWTQILHYATSISGKDEFDVDAAADNLTTLKKQDNPDVLTPKEQNYVIKSRHDSVLVCWYWYSIGIRALWSHVIIRLDSSSYHRILDTIKLKPELASSVIRLKIEYNIDQVSRTSTVVDSITHELLDHLPNLRIFQSPLRILPEKYHSQSESSPLEHRTQILGERLSDWRSIHTMDLLLAPISSIQDINLIGWVELPHLESLRVVVYRGKCCNWMAQYVATHWKVPSLRSFTFHNFDFSDDHWSTFFETWGRNLQKLKIHCLFGLAFRERLTMPNLLVLYIYKDHWVPYEIGLNWINAPNIRCLGIFDLHELACNSPEVHELRAFPNIKEVHVNFKEDPALSFECLRTIKIWRKKGIKVEIYSPM